MSVSVSPSFQRSFRFLQMVLTFLSWVSVLCCRKNLHGRSKFFASRKIDDILWLYMYGNDAKRHEKTSNEWILGGKVSVLHVANYKNSVLPNFSLEKCILLYFWCRAQPIEVRETAFHCESDDSCSKFNTCIYLCVQVVEINKKREREPRPAWARGVTALASHDGLRYY